jgi:hypothetical protein
MRLFRTIPKEVWQQESTKKELLVSAPTGSNQEQGLVNITTRVIQRRSTTGHGEPESMQEQQEEDTRSEIGALVQTETEQGCSSTKRIRDGCWCQRWS